MTPTPLRDLVESKLDARWTEWARAHPHLAEAIDRTRLIESAEARLRRDPAFQAALREADLDEATLAAAARVLALAQRLADRALSL